MVRCELALDQRDNVYVEGHTVHPASADRKERYWYRLIDGVLCCRERECSDTANQIPIAYRCAHSGGQAGRLQTDCAETEGVHPNVGHRCPGTHGVVSAIDTYIEIGECCRGHGASLSRRCSWECPS